MAYEEVAAAAPAIDVDVNVSHFEKRLEPGTVAFEISRYGDNLNFGVKFKYDTNVRIDAISSAHKGDNHDGYMEAKLLVVDTEDKVNLNAPPIDSGSRDHFSAGEVTLNGLVMFRADRRYNVVVQQTNIRATLLASYVKGTVLA